MQTKNLNIRSDHEQIHMLLALAFVSPSNIVEVLVEHEDLPVEAKPIATYYKDSYTGHQVYQGQNRRMEILRTNTT